MKILFLVVFVIASCSFRKSKIENQTLKGHNELYSEPNSEKNDYGDEIQRVVIAATNDVQGSYNIHQVHFRDEHNKKKQQINIGGLNVIENYFKILRSHYENVVLVDSGDIFPGEVKDLKLVSDFYGKMKYDAVTVGLNDFNLKLPPNVASNANLFKDFAKSSKTPLILSNLYELKTARVVEWPGTKAHLLKDVGGAKVGIIGLIPDDVVSQTPVDNRVGLFVENMLQSTLRHARLLRSLGADIIVVLTHQGVPCGHGLAQEAKLPLAKVNFEPQRQSVCDLKGILGEYLQKLPPNLVDLVVGGRHHEKMANFINGTLVMSGLDKGKSFSYVEFFVDTKERRLLKDKTVAHQPVMFCHEFFKETKDCYSEDTSINHKERIPATFLGEQILTGPSGSAEAPAQPEAKETVNVEKALEAFEADISYVPPTTRDTQLVLMELKGHELMKILEEDYNRARGDDWLPTPFSLENKALHVKIKGGSIDANKSYRILSDLEGLQQKRSLSQRITSPTSRALMGFSWNSLPLSADDVKIHMSALIR